MPTHLYCLLPAGSSVSPPAAVRAVDAGGAVAWVSNTEASRLSRDTRDAVRATVEHDRVIGAALAAGVTPIPASLADPYESDSDMKIDVAAHGPHIQDMFPAIDGMVEMTTIIAVRDVPPPENVTGRGRAYLEQLQSLPRRAASVGDRVEKALSPFGDARRRSDGGRVSLSHLVPHGQEGRYREAARVGEGEGHRIIVDGPRAPYSFALFSPRRGLVTAMWVGRTTVESQRHDSSEPGSEKPA